MTEILQSLPSSEVEKIIREAAFNHVSVDEHLKNQYPEYLPDSNYICSQCAQKRNAVWPQGHVATMHRGICAYCSTTQSLASVGDWDWPNGSTRPNVVGAGRD